MRLEELMKYDLEGNNVREIRCGIKIYSNLRGRVGVVFNEDKMTYNGIPVVCDSSIHNYECVLIHSTAENFYEDIVKALKDDANKLNKKMSKAMDNTDMQLYISTIRALRDTLELIGKYDWQLHYSEYKAPDQDEIKRLEKKINDIQDNIAIAQVSGKSESEIYGLKLDLNFETRNLERARNKIQVAVWEQNHDNQVRNHKIYKIV